MLEERIIPINIMKKKTKIKIASSHRAIRKTHGKKNVALSNYFML